MQSDNLVTKMQSIAGRLSVLFLRAVKIPLIIYLCLSFKSPSHSASQYWYGLWMVSVKPRQRTLMHLYILHQSENKIVPATFPANSPQEASRQKRRPHLPVWRDTHFQRLCTPSRCLNAIRLFAYSGQRHSACRKLRYPPAWWLTLNLCSIVALTVMI